MKKKRLYDKNGNPWHLGEDAYYFAQYVSSWGTDETEGPAAQSKTERKTRSKKVVPQEDTKPCSEDRDMSAINSIEMHGPKLKGSRP